MNVKIARQAVVAALLSLFQVLLSQLSYVVYVREIIYVGHIPLIHHVQPFQVLEKISRLI